MSRFFLLASLVTVACHQPPAPAAPKATTNPDVELRLAKLEAYIAKNAEALDFLTKIYEAQRAQADAEEDEVAPDAIFAVPIADDVKAGLVEGPPTAAVTIVKAFDFACPHCATSSSVVDQLVKDYGGKVRVVFKNMVVHPDRAMLAHLASCGAAKQNKYLAFKTAFWEKGFAPYLASRGQDTRSMERASILDIAKGAGLDLKKLEAEMDGEACRTFIAHDMAELAPFKVTGTPTFFINGLMVPGALPAEAFKTIIDEKLKVVAASGVAAAKYYDQEILGKGEKQYRSIKDPKPQP